MPSTSEASDEDDNSHDALNGSGDTAADTTSLEKPPLDQHHADTRTIRRYHILLACLFLFSTVFSWQVYAAFTHHDPWEVSRCRMAYMSPGYIRLDGLNASHSRLAGKYSLWLYREQGWDLSNKPHGVPVLFAPGNAGSYRQIRSLAAAAARQFYSSPGKPRESLLATGHQELDFFAADFNEDFSAFHAGTLREQAEYLADCIKYIRMLYTEQGLNAPTAVNVVAHSMGGIAARFMFLQKNFNPGSVKTLVTLSTPHAIPPATFDRGVETIYREINSYWRMAYATMSSPLNDTLFVSIAGGIADTMISSDYADISSLVPPTNGFSVITTSVPTLFSPVDHLAMMWCDQLRQRIISALIQGTDARRNDRARPLTERLSAFQGNLLTGLELELRTTYEAAAAVPAEDDVKVIQGQLALGGTEVADGALYRLNLDNKAQHPRRVQSTTVGRGVQIEVFACKGSEASGCYKLDEATRAQVPSVSKHTHEEGQDGFPSVVYTAWEVPEDSTNCLLKISKSAGSLIYAHGQVPFEEIRKSLLSMYMFGWQYDSEEQPILPNGAGFYFPYLDSSLIVYSLSMTTVKDCPAFGPIVRVSSGGSYESHFFSGEVVKAGIHIHSGAPYLPPSSSQQRLRLQVWHDPACAVKVELAVNRRASLGSIVTRYRSIIASWPSAILLGAMRFLLLPPDQANSRSTEFTFGDSLRYFLLRESHWWLAAISLLGISQVLMLHFKMFSDSTAPILLGTRHMLFLALAPSFLAIVTTLVLLSHIILGSLQSILGFVLIHIGLISDLRKTREERSRSRMIAFGLLSLFVLVFAPHQFAVLSLFLIQGMTTVRAGFTAHGKGVNHAVLLMLLWLLPQNGAILIVWLRNLQVGWWWPFPSDHNLLAIIGPLMLVEHLRSGKRLEIPPNKWVALVTDHFLTIAIAVVLLWGGRYVFVVGEVANLVCLWLALLQYDLVRRYL